MMASDGWYCSVGGNGATVVVYGGGEEKKEAAGPSSGEEAKDMDGRVGDEEETASM